MSARTRIGVVAVVASLGSGACVPVAAWDRGRLAHPEMSDAPNQECAGFDAHLTGAREAALEPSAAGGGGCGCN
jgi:hypothetical protein